MISSFSFGIFYALCSLSSISNSAYIRIFSNKSTYLMQPHCSPSYHRTQWPIGQETPSGSGRSQQHSVVTLNCPLGVAPSQPRVEQQSRDIDNLGLCVAPSDIECHNRYGIGGRMTTLRPII